VSEQGSEASSFSDLSDASLSASALESALMSNIRGVVLVFPPSVAILAGDEVACVPSNVTVATCTTNKLGLYLESSQMKCNEDINSS